MKFHAVPLTFAALFAAGVAFSQEQKAPAPQGDLASFKQQMLEVIRQMQAQHKDEIDSLNQKIDKQQQVIDALQKSVAGAPTTLPLPTGKGENPVTPMTGPPVAGAKTAAETAFPTTDEALIPGSTPPAAPSAFPTADNGVVPGGAPLTPGPSSLTAPISLIGGGGSKSFVNLSFDGQFSAAASTAQDLDRIEVGDHDPQHRGFNARNLEIALDGAVDPFFEAFVNIVFKLDNHNETSVETEEAFMQTTTLPWGLQVKAGQFFAPFGRINPQHPHTWDFADAPLVNGRLLGADGLRGVGAQVGWVLPSPWYSQLYLAIQNGEGNTGFSFRNPGDGGTFYGRPTIDRQLRGVQDLAFIPRWENSIDFSPTQTLLFGASGAFGPNDTGNSARTEIYGVDLFYKWKPANAEGGWPFVKWQSEAMYRRFEAGRGLDDSFPVSEKFNDWGAYSQVVWGFRKGWTTGIRGDYVHMADSPFTDDPERQTRWRLSLNLTYYPSEFSKLRLQYNHDWLEASHFLGGRDVDSVFLQFEFALGAHGAHKF